jgi:hypothetical protein
VVERLTLESASVASSVSSVASLGDDRRGAVSDVHSMDASVGRLPIFGAL